MPESGAEILRFGISYFLPWSRRFAYRQGAGWVVQHWQGTRWHYYATLAEAIAASKPPPA